MPTILSVIVGASPNPVGYQEVSGTVEVGVVPAERRVVLADRRNLSYIKSTVSMPNGTWVLNGLPEALSGVGLLVLSLDDTGTYNALVYDYVQPVAS